MRTSKSGLAFALILTLLWTPSVIAQEHLYPERSPFDGEPQFIAEHNDLLVEKFSTIFEYDVILRAIVLPSTKPSAIAIHRSSEGHSLTRLRAKERLWQGSPKELNKFDRSVEVESCTRVFPSETAERLYNLWRTALLQTRYADLGNPRSFKRDGVIYHFAVSKDTHMAGQTHSPHQGTAPYFMTKITWTLSQLCDDDRSEHWEKLDQQIWELEDALNKSSM